MYSGGLLSPWLHRESSITPISSVWPVTASVASSRALGFHGVGATSHVARLPAAQAAELLHRRSHLGVDKIRHAAHTTADAPKILASASATARTSSCSSCAAARIRRAAHTGTLSAPAPEPGVLHYDLKELVLSIGGYRNVVFCIDEFSHYVFVEFIRSSPTPTPRSNGASQLSTQPLVRPSTKQANRSRAPPSAPYTAIAWAS